MRAQALRFTRSILTLGLLLLPVSALQAAVSLPGGNLPVGIEGASYYQVLTTIGGVAPFTWVLSGNLPPGLELDGANGIISGIPTAAGPYGFTLSVTDFAGSTAQSMYSLTINFAPTGSQTRIGTCPHIALNAGWKTTITVVNLDSSPILVWVNLWEESGQALTAEMAFPQKGGGPNITAPFVNRTLGVGGSLVIELDGDPGVATESGWAEIASTGHAGAYAIFRQSVTGRADAEGTASLDSHTQTTMDVPFDNTLGYTSTVALVNNAINTPGQVTVTILDENGTAITTSQALRAIPANGHFAFSVPVAFPQTAGKRGVLEFHTTSGTNITGLAFRFNPTNSFTSVPVMYPPVLGID